MKLHLLMIAILILGGCSGQSNNSPPPPVDVTSPVEPSPSEASANPDSNAGASKTSAQPAATQSAPTPVALESGVAAISPANTTIQFVGTHMPPSPPDPRSGVFTEFSGNVFVDPATKKLKSVSVEIKTESLETAMPLLTNHLRSADFFDAKQYPAAKFESTSITGDGDVAEIVGNLTLLQATKEIRIPAKVTVSDAGLLLTGEFTIDRTSFGMTGQDRVHKDVAMRVSIGEQTQIPRGGAGIGGGSQGRRSPGGGSGSEGLAVFHQRDADKNGKLTGDEIVGKMKENLSAIDTDGDGAISEEEFRKRQSPGQGGRAKSKARRAESGAEKAEGGAEKAVGGEQSAEGQKKTEG